MSQSDGRIHVKRILKKVKRLLVPFWVFTLFAFFVYYISGRVSFLASIIGKEELSVARLIFALAFDRNNIDSHLWFAYQLFFIQVIYEVVGRCKRKYLLVISFLLNLFPYYTRVISPTLSSVIKYMIPYVLGGMFGGLYRNELWQEQILPIFQKWYAVICAIAVFFVSNNVLLLIDIDTAGHFLVTIDRLVRIMSGATGTFIVLWLTLFVKNKTVLCKLGNHSFEIYLIHQPFVVNGACLVLIKFGMPYVLTIGISSLIGIVLPMFFSTYCLERNVLGRAIIGRGGEYYDYHTGE